MPDVGFLALRTINPATLDAALPGLRAAHKTLPPKLFYDEEGCRLFHRITQLPEYYLTRTEFRMLRWVAPLVAGLTAPGSALIEYGASDEAKAAFLLHERDPDGQKVFGAYVPIDVAAPELRMACGRLARLDPELELHPIATDFSLPIILPCLKKRARLGFFPGSTIGNFDPEEARRFLSGARLTLGAGARMLVSVDLRKDREILLEAYDDSAGVTAAFNLNLLVRLNREADADFDLGSFRHRAVWNDAESRIEMHLCSLRDQVVHVGGQPILFREGESIHTENCYKWMLPSFERLVQSAGWRGLRIWVDSTELFSMHLLEAA
jgi:dimethylhistidine N-methyltransferase